MLEIKHEYKKIYSLYYKKVFNYLSRITGSLDAEDLTQEVFIKIYKALNKFNDKSSIYTWIYKVATNHLIDHMRHQKKTIDCCSLIDKDLFCKSEPEFLTEEFKLIKNEMNECICSYIKKLPVNYQTIIVLREYESMNINEIAYIMNIKSDNAKKMLTRAREKLKTILKNQCDFYYNEMNQLCCEKK